MLDIAFLDRLFAALPPAIRDSRPACALVLGSGWNRALNDLRILAECEIRGGVECEVVHACVSLSADLLRPL